MDSRRDFLKKAALLSGGAGLMGLVPPAIQKAMAINPVAGSTYLDAEHIVFLMQENRSFDHCFGSLQGVRGFNDPRAISLPNQHPVWLQTAADGAIYAPFRLNMHHTKATWMGGLPHSWADQVDARHGGKYDQWLIAKQYGNEDYNGFPMTMGYYTREDIPFYYALADAFTVCDQHFCSSLTGTTPNRLYFWSGTIRENAAANARVWNGDTDYENNAAWTTYPERLEKNGIPWRIYQNEISAGSGLTAEQDAWLANFTDNPLEWFAQYHVKLSDTYRDYLQKAPDRLTAAILELEKEALGATGKKAEAIQKEISRKKQLLSQALAEQKIYTKEAYDRLPEVEKKLHQKAFTTNRLDPDYHQLTSMMYKDGPTERELILPKGDILHEFRKDVAEGRLPTVSWLIAPEKFSDHPSAPWYGAWYVSEVLDILTKDPAVWQKTVFVITYDENDGYFDHIPPFVAPHPPGSGRASAAIDTAAEYVRHDQQDNSNPKYMRESPIGLGYRVPMVIASPWSRGGWVNSEVFDHTSSLQLLEKFLQHKYGKPVPETNITDWRRCVCGDLTSAFRPYNGEKIEMPRPVDKKAFMKSVNNARYKQPPNGAPLTAVEIKHIRQNPAAAPNMPQQEKGIRNACALPYELYADATVSDDKKTISVLLAAGNAVFDDQSAGSPFTIYAPAVYAGERCRSWAYAVVAGDRISDQWEMDKFENGRYGLQVHGPNGFFREISGSKDDPPLLISFDYERLPAAAKKLTGNIVLTITNQSDKAYTVVLADKSYRKNDRTIAVSSDTPAAVVLDLTDSFNWYDVALTVNGYPHFEKRYAGRVETGSPGKTDPYMGRTV